MTCGNRVRIIYKLTQKKKKKKKEEAKAELLVTVYKYPLSYF